MTDTVTEFEATRVGNDVIKGQLFSLTEIGVNYHRARYFGLQSVYFKARNSRKKWQGKDVIEFPFLIKGPRMS